LDNFWPCEKKEHVAENYPYPLKIENADWQEKSSEEVNSTFDDSENVKYKIQREFDLELKKREIDFDINKVTLFRVSLTSLENTLVAH